MKTETQNLFRVAIVGAASLKGKELKDVLEERNFPAAEIKLLDDDESLGQLERVQDEVAVVQPVGRDELAQMDFTFFASDEDFTRKKWKLAREAGSAIVDMSYALENEPAFLLARRGLSASWASLRSLRWSRARLSWRILRLWRWRCFCCAHAKPGQSATPLPQSLSRYRNAAERAWTNCTSRR